MLFPHQKLNPCARLIFYPHELTTAYKLIFRLICNFLINIDLYFPYFLITPILLKILVIASDIHISCCIFAPFIESYVKVLSIATLIT